MYVNDIVILSPNHANAQEQLNIMTDWCGKWAMHINPKKSQVSRCQLPLMPLDGPIETLTATTSNSFWMWQMYLKLGSKIV